MVELQDADRYAVDGDQDHLPALTVGMYRAFLARGKRGMEAMQVYLHLLFTYRLQKTDSVYAVNSYIQQGICMGEHRVKAAKSLLRNMGLIQAVRTREKGRIVQNYTRLNLLPNPGLTVGADSAPPATVGAVTARVENRTCGSGPQMLEEEIRLEEEKKLPPGAAYLPLAEELAAAVKKTFPRQRCNPAGWTRDIRLLIELDHATTEEVRHVLAWLPGAPTNGSFSWAKNILSGAKLRKHFARLLPEAGRNGRGGQVPPVDPEAARLEREAQRTREAVG